MMYWDGMEGTGRERVEGDRKSCEGKDGRNLISN